DFEDTLAIHESPTCKHSPHVLVDGKQVSKASILKDLMQHRSPRLSTDRTKRVAGIPAFANEAVPHHIAFDNPTGAPSLRIGNPVATIVRCDGECFLAVGQVNTIILGSRPMESIVLELLPDRGTKISYQIFHLAPVNSGDEPGDKYDWKWSLGFESRTIHNVPGHLVHPLNPTVSNQVPGKPTYLFSSDVLITVAANIDGYLAHYNAIPEIGHPFGFQKRSGTAAARQIDWKSSTCLNPLNFQMSAAMKSSEKSPCSNHLIECPLQCGVVLWTYNLTAHYN
ncbi:hypothetical protein B0H14DRAFT_2256911, partial [Mycena olivaceomarginata]